MKHTKKKRALALVLCMALVLSTGIAAFANENVGLQSVACPAKTLERVIKNANGEQIGTLTADVPEGAFVASSSDANIQMEIEPDSGEAGVINRIQQEMEAEGITGYDISNYVMGDVTFYVNGVAQAPQQPVTFHVTGTSVNADNAMAFADDRQNNPKLLESTTDGNGGLQFTAEVNESQTMVYGVFDVTEAAENTEDAADDTNAITEPENVAYEQTYSDDQVEIKVAAEAGILPDDAQLSVTPIVKTDITNTMSAEEKQTAEAINAKYDTTEQKLNEKANSEAYNIAGFLAYDISFADKAGNKIEPAGDVNVSMNYKKAAIPEAAQKAIEENPDNASMNVTLMHLEEDDKGEVQNVIDMVADENEKANVETTDAQSVEKAEFVSDSFSVFTLIWSPKDYTVQVKTVDTEGNEIGNTISNVSIETTTLLSEIAPTINGYVYKKAVLSSVNGPEMYQITIDKGSNDLDWWKYNTADAPSTWTEFDNQYNAVWLVYEKASVQITDDIANTGSLKAEYQADAGSTATVSSYKWYRCDTKNGTYTEVEKVNYQATTAIKTNLSDDGTKLYPAYDEGARKWYKVVATLSDGTEKESAPFQVPYYNQLQNGSFETPSVPSGYNRQWSNAYYAENEGVWQTTGTNNGRDIEIVQKNASGGSSAYSWWDNSTSSNPNRDSHDWANAAYAGNQFAELNCEAAGALYQDVLTKEGVPLNYWFAHRARGDNPTTTQYDTMYLVIMPKSAAVDSAGKELTNQTQLEGFLKSKLGNSFDPDTVYTAEGSEKIYDENGIMVLRVTSSNQRWQYINTIGGYTSTSSLTRFFFMAGKTASNNNTVGNFLDNVGFSQNLPPVADDEFSVQIKKNFEGLGNANINKIKDQITFKITAKKNGKALTDAEVEKLFGKSTITGADMTLQMDGSLTYTIANKKINKNDSYQVTITEENAELDGYTLTSSAQTTVQNDGQEATTIDGSVINELKGKVTATVAFTNTYEENNYKNINFTKIWDDADNKYDTRPKSLDVTLHATYIVTENGTTQTKTLDLTNWITPGATVTLNSDNQWKCSWRVPVYYKLENGNKVKINYAVTEGDNNSGYVYTSVTDNGNAISGTGSDYKTQFNDSGLTTGETKDNTTTQTTEKKNVLSKMRAALTSLFSKNDGDTATLAATDNTNSTGLGEPAHSKYITYNKASSDYTLNLDVTGAKGSASGVDVLFVIDTSGSMGSGNSSTYTNLLPTVKSLLTKDNGIVDKIFEKTGNKNSVAFVSFSDMDSTTTTSWYGTSGKSTFKSSVNKLSASGGTNWTYAMVKARELLSEKANSGNEKVVIFLSDGQPTYSCEQKTSSWLGTYWSETGNGSSTKNTYYQEAADQVTGSLSSAKLYSVYLTAGTKSGMETFSNKLSNSDLVDGTNLTTALNNILNKVIPTYKNVTITDTLSEYVDFVENTPVITVTKKTAGNQVTTLTKGSDYTASVTGKTVTVNLLNGNSLEDGATYTVSFKVKPSDAANNYYAEHQEYPDTGDNGTGSTSAGKKGFYSNNSSQTNLKYEIDGTKDGLQTTSYNKPVVQVTTHTLNYKKVWNQPEGVTQPTQDVTLYVTYTDGTTGTITLTNEGGYVAKETVPVTKSIAQITETTVNDYEPSYNISEDRTSAVVTNNYQKVTASSVTVKKVWDGNGPKSDIKVSLYQNVNGGDAKVYATVTLNDANNWEHTWNNLPQYEGSATDQKTYSYAVREENIPTNYQSNIKYKYGNDAITATITNTYDSNCADENYYIANVLQTEKLHINKIWDDNGNIEGLRPKNLLVEVDNMEFTLTGDTARWTQDATILKKKSENHTASEKLNESNYSQVGDTEITKVTDGINVTFRNKLNTKDITVAKHWNDGNVTDRPESVKIQLNYRQPGNKEWTKYNEYTITEEDINGTNHWTKVIHNLPTAYEYQVVELTAEDSAYSNYVSAVTQNGDTYTITNTLKWSAVKKSIGWDGSTNNSVGLTGAEFELKQGNRVIATGLSANDGKITWTPKTDSGNTVNLDTLDGTYTIHETKAPEGYVKNDQDWTVTFVNGLLTNFNNGTKTASAEQGIVITLTNKKVYDLPHTGGSGIFLFTIGGILLMGGAAWILYKNKRREVLKR